LNLDEGHIQQRASPQEILQQPADDFFKELLDLARVAG